MPALRDIERSDAMVRWRSNRLGSARFRSLSVGITSLPDHLASGTPAVVTMSAQRRRALLAELDWLERRALSDDVAGSAPTEDELATLGRRLAAWIRHDDTFAERLVELSRVEHAGRPAARRSEVPAVVRRCGRTADGGTQRARHRRRPRSVCGVAEHRTVELADDPTACLDLLLDEPTAYALASWQALDTAMLADFVVSGLYGAVVIDPARLDDGYGVLQLLTRAANGPLDGGMSAGMALGVSTSLAGYIETLAPGVRQEGPTPVIVRAVDPPLELGTYDDLVDLFGSLLRVPEAQAALGTVLAAYTFETFERIGAMLSDAPTRRTSRSSPT
jgi:hypothetical protein